MRGMSIYLMSKRDAEKAVQVLSTQLKATPFKDWYNERNLDGSFSEVFVFNSPRLASEATRVLADEYIRSKLNRPVTFDMGVMHLESRQRLGVEEDSMKALSKLRLLESKLTEARVSDIDYVRANLDKLDKFRIRDMARRIKQIDIEQKMGVYVDDRGNLSNSSIKVDLDEPIDSIIYELGQQMGGASVDVKVYQRLGSIVNHYYLRHKQRNSWVISQPTYALDSLMEFIAYVITGRYTPDLKQVHDDIEELGIDKWTLPIQFEYHGVKVKVFKNGRVDMKWPGARFAEKAQELAAAWMNYYDKRR